MWIGNNTSLQHQLVQQLHTSPLGGHSRISATIKRVQQLFAWPGLKHYVVEFVQGCLTCQQAKPEHVKYPGLLQPLPIPDHTWQMVSLDFVEGFPPSAGKNCILVVVDRFSKYNHFIQLKHLFSALGVARLFMQHIYRLHGMPLSIISDRDPIFTSHLWQELFRLVGVSLKMSSTYHPQTDGTTEHVNQCIETFLRCFANAAPSKWLDWIFSR